MHATIKRPFRCVTGAGSLSGPYLWCAAAMGEARRQRSAETDWHPRLAPTAGARGTRGGDEARARLLARTAETNTRNALRAARKAADDAARTATVAAILKGA